MAADHTWSLSGQRPLRLPHRKKLMPTIERTTGFSAAHGFGAAGYPVTGAAGIAPLGDIRNGSWSHWAAKRAALAAVSSP